FLLDREGTYLEYHAPDATLLFTSPKDFLGKKQAEVLPADLCARFAYSFAKVLQSEKPVQMEYTLSVSSEPRTFEASMVKCEDDKILAIVRDITARKNAEASLQNALAEVQRLKNQLHEENIYLQEEYRVASNFGEIIGRSEPLRRVL